MIISAEILLFEMQFYWTDANRGSRDVAVRRIRFSSAESRECSFYSLRVTCTVSSLPLPTPMSFARIPWTLKLLERNHSLRQCRYMSTQGNARPYQVYTGASYAAKPAELLPRYMRRRRNPVDFPETSDIFQCRNEVLRRPKGFPSVSAGEDFFYIQEVPHLFSFKVCEWT